MTRNEKEQRIQKENGKAFENYNVEIHATYLNAKYTLSKQTVNATTGMGLLKVFELNPSGGGPSFIGRWDGGSREIGKSERNDLDIDIYEVSDEEKRRFENGEGGYSGHHTSKVESNTGHVYQVSLRMADEKIFEGTVYFNLLRKQGFEASLQPTATLDIKFIPAED